MLVVNCYWFCFVVQDELLALAYLVSLATQSLGQEVAHVAAECGDAALKEHVENDARSTASSGTELVICTKVSRTVLRM